MIAIDTSALIAVLFAESAADEFERRIAIESACMSAVTLLEALASREAVSSWVI